ncbi:MAG: hypothetical protein AAGA56_17610, partial [Myxococcota bacterium]
MIQPDLFAQFDDLLRRERAAITGVDIVALESLTDRKLALALELEEWLKAAPAPHAQVKEQMGQLKRDLEEQTVLLAHARASVQDVVRALAAPSGVYGRAGHQ